MPIFPWPLGSCGRNNTGQIAAGWLLAVEGVCCLVDIPGWKPLEQTNSLPLVCDLISRNVRYRQRDQHCPKVAHAVISEYEPVMYYLQGPDLIKQACATVQLNKFSAKKRS